MPQKARVRYKTHLHGSMVVSGNCIPRQGRLPPYKSWSYLMQNELANEVGGRIFYTDATGLMRCPPCCWHAHVDMPTQVDMRWGRHLARCTFLRTWGAPPPSLPLPSASHALCCAAGEQVRPSQPATATTRPGGGRARWRARTGSARSGCCSARPASWARGPWSWMCSPAAWALPPVRAFPPTPTANTYMGCTATKASGSHPVSWQIHGWCSGSMHGTCCKQGYGWCSWDDRALPWGWPGVVEARLHAFLERQPEGAPAAPPQPATADADILFEDGLLTCAGGFCRRCRTYNCVTHPGPHVR